MNGVKLQVRQKLTRFDCKRRTETQSVKKLLMIIFDRSITFCALYKVPKDNDLKTLNLKLIHSYVVL